MARFLRGWKNGCLGSVARQSRVIMARLAVGSVARHYIEACREHAHHYIAPKKRLKKLPYIQNFRVASRVIISGFRDG